VDQPTAFTQSTEGTAFYTQLQADDMQQQAAGGRHGRHLESMTSYQKSIFVNRCDQLKNNPPKFHPSSI